MDAALKHFDLDVVGKDALDAGASTGGFTDCLLQRGAAIVVAIDVGHGQLLQRIRLDPRVEVMERANVRYMLPEDVGGRRFDVVVADLSFISLMMVAGALLGLAKPAADLVVLVKPQFEAGRAYYATLLGLSRQAMQRLPVGWRRRCWVRRATLSSSCTCAPVTNSVRTGAHFP